MFHCYQSLNLLHQHTCNLQQMGARFHLVILAIMLMQSHALAFRGISMKLGLTVATHDVQEATFSMG